MGFSWFLWNVSLLAHGIFLSLIDEWWTIYKNVPCYERLTRLIFRGHNHSLKKGSHKRTYIYKKKILILSFLFSHYVLDEKYDWEDHASERDIIIHYKGNWSMKIDYLCHVILVDHIWWVQFAWEISFMRLLFPFLQILIVGVEIYKLFCLSAWPSSQPSLDGKGWKNNFCMQAWNSITLFWYYYKTPFNCAINPY